MRISMQIPDPTLRDALGELLHRAGHEVVPYLRAADEPQLRIVLGPTGEPAPAGTATLVLRGGAGARAAADPVAALRAALQTAGTVVWTAPLDAPALLDALANGHDRATHEDAVPSLAGSRSPWLLVDPTHARVLGASARARSLLGLGPEGTPVPLRDVALPGSLRGALIDQSDGVLPGRHVDGIRLACWWTDAQGRRVVLLLPSPDSIDSGATRQLSALADVGRMAATLAHEIRNPVASVAGALDLLADEPDAGERQVVIRMARARLDQMRMLLDDTLRLVRPVEGPAERVDLVAVIRSAVADLTLDPQLAGISVHVDDLAASIWVRAHEEPLRQAFANLLLNAAQAQGGQGSIRIFVACHPRQAIVRVMDEGPGIPREIRDQVFSPFYTTRTEGTGLGLAFVRRVVDAAGGAVAVDDVPGGACIRLELPLAPQDEA